MQITSMLTIVAPLILALMMLGMGLSLQLRDFTRLFTNPKVVLMGCGLQLVALPLLGYLLILACGLTRELAVGFMILVACPGGPGSNVLSYVCRGDVALSVTLTAISSVLAVIWIPLLVNFALGAFMQDDFERISVATTIFAVMIITLLPLSIGMLIARKFPVFASKSESVVKYASIIFLLALVISTLLKERNNLVELLQQVGVATVSLCIISVSLGLIIPRIFKQSRVIQKTIAIEVGIQNSALAIVVASSILASTEMAIPAALYSPVMITAALLFMLHAYLTRHSSSTAEG